MTIHESFRHPLLRPTVGDLMHLGSLPFDAVGGGVPQIARSVLKHGAFHPDGFGVLGGLLGAAGHEVAGNHDWEGIRDALTGPIGEMARAGMGPAGAALGVLGGAGGGLGDVGRAALGPLGTLVGGGDSGNDGGRRRESSGAGNDREE